MKFIQYGCSRCHFVNLLVKTVETWHFLLRTNIKDLYVSFLTFFVQNDEIFLWFYVKWPSTTSLKQIFSSFELGDVCELHLRSSTFLPKNVSLLTFFCPKGPIFTQQGLNVDFYIYKKYGCPKMISLFSTSAFSIFI